ncbi:Ubiquitin-conjugating enzyme E2 27 [Orobanche hederae]
MRFLRTSNRNRTFGDRFEIPVPVRNRGDQFRFRLFRTASLAVRTGNLNTSQMVTLLNLPECGLPLKYGMVIQMVLILLSFFLHVRMQQHPNISSQSGAICLDILKDQWSPALTLKTALLSVQALLSAPEPDDPQDAVVARQYLKENQTFVRTARYWTESFAITSSIGVEEKVQKLVEMGFPEASVRSALESVGGDENLALEKLCCG